MTVVIGTSNFFITKATFRSQWCSWLAVLIIVTLNHMLSSHIGIDTVTGKAEQWSKCDLGCRIGQKARAYTLNTLT